jgi:hypothetical protein
MRTRRLPVDQSVQQAQHPAGGLPTCLPGETVALRGSFGAIVDACPISTLPRRLGSDLRKRGKQVVDDAP